MSKTNLQNRIESGKPIILAEIAPPAAPDVAGLQEMARSFAGKVHALGVSDNRDDTRMCAMVAASIIAGEGIETIMHMVTRDRNRTALAADCIGAQALGVHNFLCTSGTHKTLLPFRTVKNVYDIDATLLLEQVHNLNGGSCIGGVASPYAGPMEFQLDRIVQKIGAGAQFIVTQPVFDLDRFQSWWREVCNRGLQQRTAIIAGIRVLTDAKSAMAAAEKRPFPMIPSGLLERLSGKSGEEARKEGIRIAIETIEQLSFDDGIRGFEVVCDEDHSAAIEVLENLKSKI